MSKIDKLKSLIQADLIYRDHLYSEDDRRPLNKLLQKNGFKPIGQIQVKLKDTLEDNYSNCAGQTFTITGTSRWGLDDVIFWVNEIDGEFDFSQVDKIL